MNIREMTLEDLDQVMAIEKENFSVPWTENGFFSFLIRQDTLFLVAEDETGIAGYCGIVMAPDEGDITNVSVAGNRRRQGIGAGLVRELIRRAGEAGVTKIYLEVRESNRAAIALYEKLGFRREGLRRDYYEEPRENAVLMSRK